jgi:RES domain-containing protein
MVVWRITTSRYLRRAFDGEGARLYGGRWNSPGLAAVYCAAHQSLAILEMLVQDQPLRARYVLLPLTVPATMRIDAIEGKRLPRDWRAPTGMTATRRLGDEWLFAGRGAVLRVPSAVLPAECNYLINPRHADFGRLEIGAPEKLATDARLRARGAV